MKVIAADLGGHTLSSAVIEELDGDFSITSRFDCYTPKGRGADDVASCLARIAQKLSESSAPASMCVAIPGILDKTRRRILKFTNFASADDIDFAEHLEGKLHDMGLPVDVFLENDANCAALGEKLCGAAKSMSDCVVLTLGTGIGCGIISNGELVTGAHGLASEAGHITISGSERLCGCGGIGHLESLASADRIEAEAGAEGLPRDFKTLWADRENARVADILEPALDAIARGAASLIVTTDPEAVILSGGMSRAVGIADEIERRTLKYLPAPFRKYLRIDVSALGPDAALYGATSLCLGRVPQGGK